MPLANWVNSGSARAKRELAHQFLTIAREKKYYDQIRFIDNDGLEIVRVETRGGRTIVVADHKLQDKSNRDYFKDAITLANGSLFISRFDLNVERGEIERPYKPILRFAAPVFGQAGGKRGLLVFNYLGEVVLKRVRALFDGSDNRLLLLDRQGYYLIGPRPGNEWGFQLEGRGRFGDHHAAAWERMARAERGQFIDSGHLFTFAAIRGAMSESIRPLFAKNNRDWILVVVADLPEWTGDIGNHPLPIAIFVSVLLIFTYASWHLALSKVAREKAEEARRDLIRELHFQKFALDEHAIVSATDVRGNIIYMNDKFCQISGYSRAELMGRNHRLVKSDEHPPELYRQMWKTIVNGKPWHGEIRNRKKDGGDYWVRATIIPFVNEKGKPFRYVSIRTDITAGKRLEKDLEKALEKAEAATRAKSDFLANMSHEIRTPMNAIIGLSHLCLQTPLSAKQRDYLQKVHNSANNLLRIINEILDFSKIEAGKLDMERIDFTLEEALSNLATVVAIKAQEKKIKLLVDTESDVPTNLIGDPFRLGQILTNLANNAIKFTNSGEVAILTRLLKIEDQRAHIQFTVRDTGIGMTPTQMASLFQAFSQADTSTTRKYGGTGLGLTISKRLVEMMGGSIHVESEPGVGSRFIVEIPFGISERVLDRSYLPTKELEGLKVLAVDDNKSALEVICTLLESFTFRVTGVTGGREALTVLQEADRNDAPFDLMMIDYMMPEMDGIETANRVHERLKADRLPKIIMATAYGSEEIVCRAAQEARVDGFVIKPFNQSLLFDVIMETFGQTTGPVRGPAPALIPGVGGKPCMSGRGARILLVEDNELNRQVAQELLQRAGLRVFCAENGQEALLMVQEEPFDGVLMDLQMPVMDGLSATREIRQLAGFDRLPIIAMTANAMAGDREKCLAAGMNDHIAKPIDPGSLFEALNKWVVPAAPDSMAVGFGPEGAVAGIQEGAMPEISGVNTDQGLKHAGGDQQLYLKLLIRFCGNQRGIDERIERALQQGDRLSAERLAHTLKGTSGTIGAEALFVAAQSLERCIKDGEPVPICAKLLEETMEHLEQTIESIEKALPAIVDDPLLDQPDRKGEVDMKTFQPLFQTAIDQLREYDSEIEESMVSLKNQCIDKRMAERFREVERLVNQYEFDAALEIMLIWAEELGIVPAGLDG